MAALAHLATTEEPMAKVAVGMAVVTCTAEGWARVARAEAATREGPAERERAAAAVA